MKEKKFIQGKDIGLHRAELDRYDKTINLISNRINQMGAFVHTRASVAKRQEIDTFLVDAFAYKFEVLTDTLEYIKELWVMTSKYLQTAITNISDIQGQTTNRSVKSLQVITTVGVVSGILGYLSKSELPQLNAVGLVYFVLLIAITWGINHTIMKFYKNKVYQLTMTDHTREI